MAGVLMTNVATEETHRTFISPDRLSLDGHLMRGGSSDVLLSNSICDVQDISRTILSVTFDTVG